MPAAEESIPLRCQDCHIFTDTLTEIKLLAAEVDLIDSTQYELERFFNPDQINFALSNLAFRLVELRLQIEQDIFYATGCPGTNSAKRVGASRAIQVTVCQSPFKE